jgi:transcriptional regulator with XRE-family HTH domain
VLFVVKTLKAVDSDKEQVGINIAAARKAEGLTQIQLAEQMRQRGHGWQQNTVSRIEGGKQALDVTEIEDLAEVLSTDFLAGTQLGAALDSLSRTMANQLIDNQLRQAEQALAAASDALAVLKRTITTSLVFTDSAGLTDS